MGKVIVVIVSSRCFLVNIFVGITGTSFTVRFCLTVTIVELLPDTGTVQHSSFLTGGIVTSAGLISIKRGLVYTLSPLSGCYGSVHLSGYSDLVMS